MMSIRLKAFVTARSQSAVKGIWTQPGRKTSLMKT